jgi:hypothetical protein
LNGSEWLLVFRGREEEHRINLGRSGQRDRLSGWANTLCRYLRELNRASEAVYVVEKSLFEPAEPQTVLLVFPGWTARTHSPGFRGVCTRLARSIIPAHLQMDVRWLGPSQMQYFEEYHRRWRECLRGDFSKKTRITLQNGMMEAVSADFVSRRQA